MAIVMDKGDGDLVAVVPVGWEGLAGGLDGFVRVVGVDVGGHVGDAGAGGHRGQSWHRGEAPVELLSHGLGQRVNITECQVAVCAEKIILFIEGNIMKY